jgi:spore coat protein U-like protein
MMGLARLLRNACACINAPKRGRSTLFLAAVSLLAPASAQANCTTISATPLAFGTYTGLAVTNSTAAVTIGCSITYNYRVGLNAGTGSGASVTTREMTSGANTLSYQMFQDSAQSVNWGNTLNSDANAGTTTKSNTVLTIYAKLLATQYPAPGFYTDTVTAAALNSNGINTTFTASTTVQPTCSFTTTTLAFGIYTGGALSGTGTLVVTCTNTTPYQIGINTGLHGSGSAYNWNMAGPGGVLANYSLYRDSAHTQLWGGTIGTGGDSINGNGSGAAQTITFYGAVPAGQAVSPGAYTDTVNVILYY